jgi:FAD:protein FMN transferase
MGTLLQIEARGPASETVGRAIEAALAAVERVDRLMSFHAQDSELTLVNRGAQHAPIAVSP